MYTIYSDGNLVYSPNLANIEDGGYAVIDPVVTLELNSVGSAEFKMPSVNPMFDGIQKLKSEIKIYDERPGAIRQRIFRGRVLDDNIDFLNRKEIYAESELAYFNDSRARPYKFNGTVSEYFTFLVNQHNLQVDANKQFRVGRCTVTDPNDYITRANSEYPKTLQEMKDKLLDLLGGYLIPRYEIENGEEVEYLDYLSESGSESTQMIVFAENLLDLSKFVDAAEVYTIIIPLGKADSNTGERLTIKSVNNGKDYIESSFGISLYGRISNPVIWDDVENAQNLMSRGQEELTFSVLAAITIEINAFDLHLLDVNTDALKVGKYNRVVSTPHNINSLFRCIKTKINLKDPDKSEYTFGSAVATLTKTSAKNTTAVVNIASAASEAKTGANAAANALNIALGEIAVIADDYVNKATYNNLEARVAALEGN